MPPASLSELGGQPEASGGQSGPSTGNLFAARPSALNRSRPAAEEPYQRFWLIIYQREPACPHCRMPAALSPDPGLSGPPFFTCWTPGPVAERHLHPSSPRDPHSGQQGTQWGGRACTLPGCNGDASPPLGAHGGKPTAAAAHTGRRAGALVRGSVLTQSPLAICAAHPEIPAQPF